MTADIELLPLPKWLLEGFTDPTIERLCDYTRANVAHATAAKDAEIEALRELCGMAYQLAGVHDAPEKWLDALSNAAAGRPFSTDGLLPYMPQAVCEAEARAERLAEEVEALQEQLDAARRESADRERGRARNWLRAERLAKEVEALKSDLGDYMDAANYQAARAKRWEERCEEEVRQGDALREQLRDLRAALRDHDQETNK